MGTGASSPQRSLAGLIGQTHPRLLIENRARGGAKFADVVRQLGADERFDIVLVQAGGNDVILMPAGNVGNAAFFFAPVSWRMTQRSRAMRGFVRDAAARTGATYVNMFHERADDPFARDKRLNASDGGYEVWLHELMAQTDLARRLSRASAG